MMGDLPEGRRGHYLALALACIGAVLVWICVLAPVIGWYRQRAADIDAVRQVDAHMHWVAEHLPETRRRVRMELSRTDSSAPFLMDSRDAIAGAHLQQVIQTIARTAHVTLNSTEMLPAIGVSGGLRKIALRISIDAQWDALIALIKEIENNRPSLVISETDIHVGRLTQSEQDVPVSATLVVVGFRSQIGKRP